MNMPAARETNSVGVRVAAALLAVASVAVVGLVIWCVTQRLTYPHELSKMEGGFVDHARRSAAGLPAYAPPSAEFASFLYMPFAHVVGGWFVKLGLDGFLATRVVSLLGIVGAIAVGMALVLRATGRRSLALLVPALLCARYFDVECFYDQARPDNLMAFFCLAAAFALTLRSSAAAVLLFAASGLLAFFTKQSAAAFLAVLLAGTALVRFKVALGAGMSLAAATIPLFFWFDARSDGWMRQYTFTIARTHRADWQGLRELATSEFLNHFLLATVAAGVAAIAALRSLRATREEVRGGPDSIGEGRKLARHVVVALVLADGAFSFASSTQVLAVRNVYVIYAIAAATFLPVALAWLGERWKSGRARTIGAIAACLVLSADMLRGARDPRPFTPGAEDVATWKEMHEACARLGPRERTWIMLHPASWGGREGDPYHVHFGALSDLIGGYYGEMTGVKLPSDLLDRIERRWYTSIVVARWDKRSTALLAGRYAPAEGVAPIKLPMFSGYEPGKSEIWVPLPAR